ncbi:hypothetical protein D047_3781A, partial [Vibrio parahaemolyticus VPTS-2010_2]
MPAQT